MATDVGPLREALLEYLRISVADGAQAMVDASKEAAQVRTGAMRDGIHADDPVANGDQVTTTFYSDAEYSSFMDSGTAPHLIEGAPLLSFFWDKIGRQAVFRYVNHPGTVGSSFFDLTLQDALEGALEGALDSNTGVF